MASNWNSPSKISVFTWELNSTHLHLNFMTSIDTKLYANEATSSPRFWLIFALLAEKEIQYLIHFGME